MFANRSRPYSSQRRGGVAMLNFGVGSRSRDIRTEKKFVDMAQTTFAANTTGTIALVATIAQGASENQRVGRKIYFKSIQCHGFLQSDTATTITNARYMLVYDAQPGASLPAITDILNTANYNSFLNDANKDRFTVLRDKKYALCGNITTPSTGKEIYAINFFQRLKNLPSTFNTTTGAIGDITTGAIYCLSVGTTVAGTADGNFGLGFRVRYIDP